MFLEPLLYIRLATFLASSLYVVYIRTIFSLKENLRSLLILSKFGHCPSCRGLSPQSRASVYSYTVYKAVPFF